MRFLYQETDLSQRGLADLICLKYIICNVDRNSVIKLNGRIPVLNIGPISVLPEYQRKDIGKALITNMIDKVK